MSNDQLEQFLASLTGGKYGLLFGSYFVSGKIPVERNCYGFIWINTGDDPVRINGLRLKPFPPGFPDLSGESFSFVDPWRNTYNRDFTIAFEGTGTAPGLNIVQVTKENT